MGSADKQGPSRQGRKTVLIAAGKVAVSVALIVWILRSFDIGAIVGRLATVSPGALALAGTLELIAIVVTAWRWQLVLAAVEVNAPFIPVARLFYIGQFINQVLPANVGGDIYRVWNIFSGGQNFLRAMMSVALDRIVAMAGLALLALPGIYTLFQIPSARVPALSMALAVAGIGLAIAGLLAFSAILPARIAHLLPSLAPALDWLAQASRLARSVFLAPRATPLIVVLAVIGHGLAISAIIVLARALGIDLGIGLALALIPPVILASVVPISYGGWGVREGAMAISLGYAGIPAEAAVGLSLLFGGVVLAISLPAGLWWLAAAASRRASAGRQD